MLLLAALILLPLGGIATLLLGHSATPSGTHGKSILQRARNHCSWLGAGSVVLASVLGSIPAVQVLLRGGSISTISTPSPIPFGQFHIELDSLAAWFLLPMLFLSAVCAIYGVGYWRSEQERRALGPAWFFYGMLVFGMCMVLLARNAVLFLYAWEVMAVASFFLVTFEHERESVREAGWIYLVATHLGTAFLLVFFLLMSRATGSMDFDVWAEKGVQPHGLAGVLFLLAVIGFGTKAGFMPFHVWLPEAHPAAPSHVSALMSGVMIKTGIYGLLRSLKFLGAPDPWWGWLLLGIGLASGIIGIVFALAQHDLKRLLAYSSVENIGLITIGIGLGVLGIAYHQPVLSILGFAGALLHALNHSLFKGLLFLAAGSVAHGTGTRQMDRLGGLLKHMRSTGILFLFGAIAICGLPPLNGFVSEFILASASLSGITAHAGELNQAPQTAIAGLFALIGLGVIGGFAAAAFTKAFGIVFLGEPRAPLESKPHDTAGLTWPMALLACACVALAGGATWLLKVLAPLLADLGHLERETVRSALDLPSSVLATVSICGLLLVLLSAVLLFVRSGLLAGRAVGSTGTWDCGYARPTSRMQYTASSFSQPIGSLFTWLLGTRYSGQRPEGIFPAHASFSTETPDLCHGNLYHPAFLKANWGLAKLRWLQRGQVQLYVLYIAVTLVLLLIWKFQ